MYNQPYFIPGYISRAAAPTMINGAMKGAMAGARGASSGLGIFSRLGNSLSLFRNINWGSLINNASRTLNVVNQAIPLVRQAGPMFNNMKSMLKIASVFKDETDKKPIRKGNQASNSTNYRANVYTNTVNKNNNLTEYSTTVQEREHNDVIDEYDNSPTFFIAS